jgi:hypothetical protein
MEESEFVFKFPVHKNNSKPRNYHFYAMPYLDKESVRKRKTNYHNYSSSPIIEEEYQNMTNENYIKREKMLLKDKELKKKYTKKFNYLNNGFKFIFVISSLSIIMAFVELRYLNPSELIIGVLLLCCISASFCFMLVININGGVLLDTYSYVAFYLHCMLESVLFGFLFGFKIINFILVFDKLNKGNCNIKYQCPGNFGYFVILSVNLLIFLGFILNIKFILYVFWYSFKILILKKKTLFQKQMDLDREEKLKNTKIEFVDDVEESINDSLNKFQ